MDKKLEPNQFYELRLKNQMETSGGRADHIYVDENLVQWLAKRVQVDYSFDKYSLRGVFTYAYQVLLDDRGNKIPAPENWDGGFPILRVRNLL